MIFVYPKYYVNPTTACYHNTRTLIVRFMCVTEIISVLEVLVLGFDIYSFVYYVQSCCNGAVASNIQTSLKWNCYSD